MTELEEVNNLDVNESEERDPGASRRSPITNSNDLHSTPGVDSRHGAGGSASAGPHFSTLLGHGAAPTAQMGPSGFYLNPTSTLPSCLMPDSFTGSGDFEDYLHQFNTAAMLSGWHSSRHDNRPQYFALRLRDNALHFYTTLSPEQQNDFDLLVDAFRQNYTTNVDILKARLKAAKQQPSQDIATFLCDIRTLARRAYRAHPHLIDQIVLTSFIEGLQSSTLRWELRKTKPSTADEALTLAIELDSFLALERQNNAPASSSFPSSINSIAANALQMDPMDELVKSLRKEINELKSSIHRRQNSPERGRNQYRTSDPNRNRSGSNEQKHYRQNFEPRNDERRSNRYDNRSNSGDRSENRATHRNDRSTSYDRQNGFKSRSVRFEEDRGRTNNSESPYRHNQSMRYNTNSKNAGNHQPMNSNSNKTSPRYQPQNQECRHCKRRNHASHECQACFNCLRVGHFRRDCPMQRSNQEN